MIIMGLFNDTTHTCEMNTLRQSNHVIYNLTQTKAPLSNTDDKRHYIDNINSLAHGHYQINTYIKQHQQQWYYLQSII